MTPFAAGSAVTSAIGGRLVSRFERSLVTGGLTVVLVGVIGVDVVLGTVHDSSLGWWLAGPLLVAGIGSGLVISPNITLTVAKVPVERAGTAGGLLQTGQRIGTAAGIALVGAVFYSGVASGAGLDASTACAWRPLSSPLPCSPARSTCEGDAVAHGRARRWPRRRRPPTPGGAEPSASVSLRPRGRTSSRRRGPPRCAPAGGARWRRWPR